jgi:arylformamidase
MKDKRHIWDISQTLRPGLPVWPGDTAFSASPTWVMGADCPVNVARFTLSTHAGSHADAPLHYGKGAKAIAEVDISRYIGRCRLIDVTAAGPVVTLTDCEAQLEAGLERVLFRTCKKAPQGRWDENFKAISPAVIDLAAKRGGFLIGTDTPSLDPQNSKTMDAHQAVLRHHMSILEGLVLDDIPPGDYELIALPLKLSGLDSSPVRAILRSL